MRVSRWILPFLLLLMAIFVSSCSREETFIDIPEAESAEEFDPPTVDHELELSGEFVDLPAQTFAIVPGESTVRFEIDEDLRSMDTGWGRPTRVTVVGISDQVFGEVLIDFEEFSQSRFEPITIDAASFKTDQPLRTIAVRNRIFEADTYETITFIPNEIRGLPEGVRYGEEIAFSIDGDLTVRGLTLPQTFEVTATLVDGNQLVGTAGTAVTYESYELRIPNVAAVTNIEDEVELYIDFVARTP